MGTRTRTVVKSALIVLAVVGAGLILFNLGYWIDQARYTFNVSAPDLPVTADAEYAAPDTIYIDKFGLVAPVVYVTKQTEEAYQGAMSRGVGHFPGTAEIGERGNAYIFGHSSRAPWSGSDYDTIFSLIPRLEIGDTVRATNHDGRLFTYTVTRKFVVEPNDTTVLDQYGNKKRILTLQTSWPLGMTLRRYVVQAEIQED